MEIVIQESAADSSRAAARVVANLIQEKPSAVLGLATGSTPVQLYQELIRIHKEEGLSFAHVTTFNLDEYVGLQPDHKASYFHFMHEHLLNHIDINPKRVHIPDGLAPDIPTHCRKYEEDIKAAGGIDIQILGIGSDGHIGFNEPSSSLASRTRIKTLTEVTRRDNALFFDSPDLVPEHVITMGLGTITEARAVLLLAFGEKKAEIATAMIEGPVTASVPASVLQFHNNAKIYLDRPAASKLRRSEYYNFVFGKKPDWQRY